MEPLFQDLPYALRQVGKSPGFAAIAVLTVALGIGSNAAIFSFVDALYLKPLPVSHPERLVRIYGKGPSGHYGAGFSYPEFEQIRDHNSSFSSLAVETQVAQLHLVSGGDAEEIRGEFVSGNYFSLLGVQRYECVKSKARHRLLNLPLKTESAGCTPAQKAITDPTLI